MSLYAIIIRTAQGDRLGALAASEREAEQEAQHLKALNFPARVIVLSKDAGRIVEYARRRQDMPLTHAIAQELIAAHILTTRYTLTPAARRCIRRVTR